MSCGERGGWRCHVCRRDGQLQLQQSAFTREMTNGENSALQHHIAKKQRKPCYSTYNIIFLLCIGVYVRTCVHTGVHTYVRMYIWAFIE